MFRPIYSYICLLLLPFFSEAQPLKTIWQIGKADHSASEFALAPNGFQRFVGHDFGFEDKFFLVGFSKEKKDFPYVLPGPVDTWGGTWNTSGWRTNQINVLFELVQKPIASGYRLRVDLIDYAKKFLPLIKIHINDQDTVIQLRAEGHDVNRQPHPTQNEPYVDSAALYGNLSNATALSLDIPIAAGMLRKGGNRIMITILQGSWVMFDRVVLEGPGMIDVEKPKDVFISSVKPAEYELQTDEGRVQPLLVETQYLNGAPNVELVLDGKKIWKTSIGKTNYLLECPMPAVVSARNSRYQLLADDRLVASGMVYRSPKPEQKLSNYVDTRIGSAHSRWMIAPGPWMPFSMVKISPDNQNAGWMGGYEPNYESIGTFSHIHEWTLGGLGLFATNGTLKTRIGDELQPGSGYRSQIDKNTEEAPIGYYKVHLTDYDIWAELTSTTRCSFTRFTFPKNKDSARILLDFNVPAEYSYDLKQVKWQKVNEHRIEGFSHQFSRNVWSDDADQDYTLHFVLETDQPFANLGFWTDSTTENGTSLDIHNVKNTGVFMQFDSRKHPIVQVRMGVSFVSTENATQNLETEVSKPFGWNFNLVRKHQEDTWNDLFDRVKVTTNNRLDKVKFYNSMYRSLCSRNTFSDINGQWRGTNGNVQKLPKSDDVALGCDAFWNTFWNLNQFWNLVTPEWSSRWVRSQLSMYDAYGWLAKGPAGMNYIPVMVGEHEIPQMVSAYQMGIRDFDAEKVLDASIKMQTTPAQKVYAGFAGNRDLMPYLRHGYVPTDSGRFSNTMEYAFDDWAVGQMAKALGKQDAYEQFNRRGAWWQNALDSNGYCHMRLSNGQFTPDFDPHRSGANHQYVESNGWQMSFFVPQDIPALVKKIDADTFANRLEWGFERSEPWRYNGLNDQYWDCPVEQGNEQTMHLPFLFNYAGKPWLTQKWTRSILDRYYGAGISNAYLGDEDQGQMSAWFVMASIGLFQTDGGTNHNPIYELASPIFNRIDIDLGNRYGRGKKFTILAEGASYENIYIQKAYLNGKGLNSFRFPAKELLAGGQLRLVMGAKPNMNWGLSDIP